MHAIPTKQHELNNTNIYFQLACYDPRNMSLNCPWNSALNYQLYLIFKAVSQGIQKMPLTAQYSSRKSCMVGLSLWYKITNLQPLQSLYPTSVSAACIICLSSLSYFSLYFFRFETIFSSTSGDKKLLGRGRHMN